MPRMANWDTAMGYQLYLEGRSDGEIADECKVKISTVKAMRMNKWRKNPDGGRKNRAEYKSLDDELGEAPPGICDGVAGLTPGMALNAIDDPAEVEALVDAHSELNPQNSELERKEVAEVPEDKKHDVDRMMEVIAKMTSGMGGIKAVCVGNIIQSLWNLNSVDDVRGALNILNWLEENYDFG